MAPSSDIVGREVELASVERFLDSVTAGPVFFVIEGEAGIGKTTIWDAGVARARERLCWVLMSRPAESETKMSYAALGDLLDPVLEETLRQLPEPQRRALEVALLRTKAKGAPPEPRTVGVAVLNVLRALAKVAPVVVAVDDLQWLDPSSARTLEFALRRLESLPVGLLATWRNGPRRVGAIALTGAERVPVGPLDAAALDPVIRAHLDTGFAPPTLHRLEKVSGGNPFYALEIARALVQQGGQMAPGEPLPIPHDLDELVGRRLARLPSGTRTALVAAAALSRPTSALVAAATSKGDELDKAERAGVIAIDREAIHFTHPLLAAAVYASATANERRVLHRRIADAVEDREERARHLALAAEGPDEEVAAALEAASVAARGRGAPETAAEHAEQAWRLTPPDRVEDVQRRKIGAADHLLHSGDHRRAHTLIDQAISALDAGPLRARALVTLGLIQAHAFNRWDESIATLEQALKEVGDDERLRAETERQVGWSSAARSRALQAEPHVGAALELAERLGDRVLLAEALAAYASVEFQRGRGFRRDLMERALALDTSYEHARIFRHPYWALRTPLQCSGDLAGARVALETLLRLAHERGEENAPPWLLWALSEVEKEAGDWDAALRLADEAQALAVQTGQETPRQNALETRAETEAHYGRTEAARKWAEQELTSDGEHWGAQMLLGFIELSLERSAAAARHLAPVLKEARRHGVDDPSVYPFWPDAIEALVGTGELDRAEEVLEWLEERGRMLDRPWALATAGRCRALLCAARGDLASALESVEAALRAHERLPQPFELARTLLVKGRIARRAKQKRMAREALEQAVEIFDRMGAALWSKQARGELARIGGRVATGDLTPTQSRIAELVASGHTNREVAEAMFVTVKTVEANLSKIYRKVGVTSRRELARELRSGAPTKADKGAKPRQT